MINFKKPEISDKEWMEPLIAAANMSGSHQNFTNIFAWSEIINSRVARVNDYLVVKSGKGDNQRYFYPSGWGDLKSAIEIMKQDAAECGHEFFLGGLSPENIEVLNSLYPGKFEYKERRDGFDYVYLLVKLVTLSGNKLHSKRNHINRFKANNSNWSFEEITLDNLIDCWEMNSIWCKTHAQEDDQIMKEMCAVTHCFDHYAELGLEGGLLRLNGEVIAYTMGEKLNSDTYVIHIEKAFGEIQGAYQMINCEFATIVQQKYPHIIYVNREEDMGYEGLRKAKLSYHPYKMEVKSLGRYL